MANNNIHILIVDDDDRIRSLLKDYLSSKNYIVSSAENAEEAKKKIGYLYLLTPKGINEKTKITIRFMKIKMQEYETLRKEIEKNK